MYSIKETFYTLQGEGAHTGRPAVFCRFSGCNLWSGQEKHRATAQCSFCDTDFVGTDGVNGGKFATAAALASHIAKQWPADSLERPSAGHSYTGRPYVVLTGGEPLLQLDNALIEALHEQGFEIGVETNGTLLPPAGIDWLCVSPKGTTDVVISQCNELKLVYPQPDALPERFEHIQASFYYLTPMADPLVEKADSCGDEGEVDSFSRQAPLYRDTVTRQTIEYCLQHPKWRLNLQSHKIINIA